MKLSSAAHRHGYAFGHLLVCLLGALLIGGNRTSLTDRFGKLRVAADNLLLPKPEVTLVASLGYRAALADFIFGHVLVSYGIHFQEKRLFEHVGDYLDAINTLDPKFRDPYRFADTLLTVQPQSPPLAFYLKARAILARGVKERPYDQELWTSAGQFLGYIAPQRLKDEAQREDFKREGARYLMRACELIGSDKNLPFHCITAANLLSKQGDRAAAKRFLERLLVVSEDEELRALTLRKLRSISDAEDVERAQRHEQRYRIVALRDNAAFLSRVELDAVGPGTNLTLCSGLDAEADEACAGSWRRLAEHWQKADESSP